MSGEEGREVSAVIALPLKAVNGVDNVSEALGYSSSGMPVREVLLLSMQVT